MKFDVSPAVRDGLLFLASLFCLGLAVGYQSQRLPKLERQWERFEQRMRLPSEEVIRMATLGYDNIYSDWLWLKSIQAFGMGWITEDGSTEPIYQYFDTLTDIDPHFISAYRFANLIIGDNRLDWKRGQDILRKGVYHNPGNYDLPYLGLYNAIWQMDDETDAKWFAEQLNDIPDAPGFMKRLQEYIERQAGRYEVAFEYNVRYYLEYLASDNDVELNIVDTRIKALLDNWYRRELNQAVERYIEKYGQHPESMESLLEPGIRPNFTAPTLTAFDEALQAHSREVDRLKPGQDIPQELVDSIKKESMEQIIGLPPDPYGQWYFIHRPTLAAYKSGEVGEIDGRLPYVVAPRDLFPITNRNSMNAQRFIINYIQENGEKPAPEDLERFLGRDPLGGHYVYEPDAEESPQFGMYYSTAARRINEAEDPRMGISGTGPFPMPLEPSLKDFPREREWGREKGYILPDGTEVWELPEEEAPEAEGVAPDDEPAGDQMPLVRPEGQGGPQVDMPQ